MNVLEDLNIKIFADSASLEELKEMNSKTWISGFTTNPTLMRKHGVKDYEAFAKEALNIVTEKPISFEVFVDQFDEMEAQAREIASWGSNVFVKIPITNTKGEYSDELVHRLTKAGVAVNVTAVFTLKQVKMILDNLSDQASSVISVFAGRIADTGKDPLPTMKKVIEEVSNRKNIEILWASPRELLNLFQANDLGCDIITLTSDFLKKFKHIGKSLEEFSLETVKMFYDDAKNSKYSIDYSKITL